ncbi:MAG: hypothetical protein ACRBCL_01450 [Maritimibacter sp.]
MKNKKPLNASAALDVVSMADRHFVRVLEALDTALDNLADGAAVATDVRAVRDLSVELRKATGIVFEERKRSGTAKDSNTGAGDLDLDAARDEIGRRLDRIRNAQGEAGVSGQS